MKYIGKKIVTLIMTLFLVSVAAFLAFQVIPGDVVTSILGTEATPEREEQLREELGFNKSPVWRYADWAGAVLHGDFGVSYRYSKNMNEMMPVKELIGDKLPVTLWLAVISMVLIVLVSIPLGVIWARSRNPILDGLLGVITQITMAIPAFFLGILVTFVFGIVLRLFPGISAVSDFPGSVHCPAKNRHDCPVSAKFHADGAESRLCADSQKQGLQQEKDCVRPCAAQCYDAGADLSWHDDCGDPRRKHCGRAGVRASWNRTAADQLRVHQRFSGGRDFDSVYYLCCDFCIFSGRHSVSGSGSQNQ